MREKENIYGRIFSVCFHFLLNLAFVYCLVQGYTYSYHFSYTLFGDLPKSVVKMADTTVVIEEGKGAKEVASLLEQSGIVESKYLFMARAYIGKYNNKIVAGKYILNSNMSPDTICKVICGMQSEGTS